MKYFLIVMVYFGLGSKTIAQLIQGVGPMKINKTTTAFIDSLVTNGYKIRQVADARAPENKQIVEYIRRGFPNVYAPVNEEYRFFRIYSLLISDINTRNLFLKFYHDTLYELTISGDFDFQMAMLQKYKYKIETHKKKIVCQNGFGAIFNYEQRSDFFWFRKDINIVAVYEDSKLYYECKEFDVNLFSIWDVKQKKKYEKLQEIDEKEDLEIKEEIRKKELKDL